MPNGVSRHLYLYPAFGHERRLEYIPFPSSFLYFGPHLPPFIPRIVSTRAFPRLVVRVSYKFGVHSVPIPALSLPASHFFTTYCAMNSTIESTQAIPTHTTSVVMWVLVALAVLFLFGAGTFLHHAYRRCAVKRKRFPFPLRA